MEHSDLMILHQEQTAFEGLPCLQLTERFSPIETLDSYDPYGLSANDGGFRPTAVTFVLESKILQLTEASVQIRVCFDEVFSSRPANFLADEAVSVLRGIQFHSDLSDHAIKRMWVHHEALARRTHKGLSRYVRIWLENPLDIDGAKVAGFTLLEFPNIQTLESEYFVDERSAHEVAHETSHFISGATRRVYLRKKLDP